MIVLRFFSFFEKTIKLGFDSSGCQNIFCNLWFKFKFQLFPGYDMNRGMFVKNSLVSFLEEIKCHFSIVNRRNFMKQTINGWDRQWRTRHNYLAKGVLRRAKGHPRHRQRSVGHEPGIYITIRHTFTVSFRVHSIREGGTPSARTSAGRPGAFCIFYFLVFYRGPPRYVLFIYFILFVPCMVFGAFIEADVRGKVVGKTVWVRRVHRGLGTRWRLHPGGLLGWHQGKTDRCSVKNETRWKRRCRLTLGQGIRPHLTGWWMAIPCTGRHMSPL